MACFMLLLFMQYISLALAAEYPLPSLMAFKSAVAEDPFSALSNWNLTSHHFCKWKGIQCKQGVVIGIDLRNLSLRGFIPPELGNLSSLEFLDLSYNKLGGRRIPSALGRLTGLKKLYLSRNDIKGSIPPELGNLDKLQVLSSYGNGHTGSIPAALGNCSMLQRIDLSENNLTGTFPIEMGMLSRLLHIDVYENHLQGGLPHHLLNCTELRNLSLSYNGFSGPIPSEIGHRLANLEWLLLAGNNLSGSIPKSLGNCSNLSHVEMAFNRLGGIIPQELGRLSQLVVFNVPANGFISGRSTGPIPILEALSNCSKLQKMDISFNHLTGSLPASISKLSDTLIFLNLERNNIGGNIPKEIGNLSALIEFYMAINSLVGRIPSEIENLPNLAAIDLSNNKLEGNIPREIQRLHENLQILYLSNNNLSGLIPDTIGEMENLRELNLSMNRFYGRIPPEIGKCKLLEILDLCRNSLSGPIPLEVASLRNLVFSFDLSQNALTGPVPREIGGMQMVQLLDLSANNLSGSIPAQITGLVGVLYLNLSYNHLGGVLPPEIGQKLSMLQSLDLSHNKITGPVPSSIFKLDMLILLNLFSNNFTGRVPCSSGLKNLNSTSFVGNPGLCGDCWGLAACSSAKTQHTNSKNKKNIILICSLVGGFGVVGCIGLSFWLFTRGLNKVSGPASSSYTAGEYLRITREELRRATNDYDQRNLMGVGSFGSVYRGLLPNEQTVAVKVFTASNAQQAEKSFLTECKTLGKVRHRNLVKIITSCSTGDFHALVTEFMPNGSLHQHLHGNAEKLSLERRLRILCDVAHGVSYLHHDCSPAIVHCDLKPQNVLLDESMTGRVGDFGLARVFSPSDDAATTTGSLKGTVGYIPPEYGVGGRVCSKGDVYSYGILVLEVVTEKKPTDEMFARGLTLRSWVAASLPSIAGDCGEQMMSPESDEDTSWAVEGLLQLGLWCSCEVPENRPTMKEVENRLEKISAGVNAQQSNS